MFENRLKELAKWNLLRQVISRGSKQGAVISLGRKRIINFSSNDYLGLAGHPDIIERACKATKKYGTGTGASRLLAGGTLIHERLEKITAEFKGTAAALIFNSGYAANTGIIPAISSEEDVIYSDELNHASIIDGCRLSKAKTVIYRHKDIGHLKDLLKKERSSRVIIITDTVFSMDGDIAPLGELYKICHAINSSGHNKQSAILYLDDAHGTGVLGDGRGALSHVGISPEPWIIQMGTFSKALGSYGAFVAGSEDVIKWILNTARSFMFSTALPASTIAASEAAIGIIKNNRSFVRRLWSNRLKLVRGLISAGYDIGQSETPIIPVLTTTTENALKLSSFLMEKGIYVPAIRPPTVKEPRIRISVSAAHTDRHINLLIKALKEARKILF